MPQLDKPFISWDGEGISDHAGVMQRYVLFGCSTGDRVIAPDLTTEQCLDLLLTVKRENPYSTFVGYATDYDVNMILRDVPGRFVRQLWEEGKTAWNGYKFRYYPHKMLSVSKQGYPAAILFDVFTFFGTSFVRALQDYQIGSQDERDFILRGKQRRSTFRDEDLHRDIVPYWEAELRLLQCLCQTLRSLLRTAGIHLSKWHGPGAIAANLLSRHHIKGHITKNHPRDFVTAICSAYAGGRFETFSLGRYVGKVYQYDIRSAYPHILRSLPPLQGAKWHPFRGSQGEVYPWSLYHCESYTGNTRGSIGIPHYRYPNGNVAYPLSGEGVWLYGVTVLSMLKQGWSLDIDRGFDLVTSAKASPFRFVEELYRARQIWKKQGNQAQWAAKLGMNSLYGKLAQTVGESSKAPPFHCLEWAGMITAAVRALIADAMYLSPSTVVACETDSVISLVPLPLPLSDKLGDWEVTEYDEIIYLQSGLYFVGGKAGKAKTRGINAGLLSYETVRSWLADPANVRLTVETHTFNGMGTGFDTGLWCQWTNSTKTINPLSVDGKRYHNPRGCPQCQKGMSLDQTLHPMEVNPTAGKGESTIHSLPWY